MKARSMCSVALVAMLVFALQALAQRGQSQDLRQMRGMSGLRMQAQKRMAAKRMRRDSHSMGIAKARGNKKHKKTH